MPDEKINDPERMKAAEELSKLVVDQSRTEELRATVILPVGSLSPVVLTEMAPILRQTTLPLMLMTATYVAMDEIFFYTQPGLEHQLLDTLVSGFRQGLEGSLQNALERRRREESGDDKT